MKKMTSLGDKYLHLCFKRSWEIHLKEKFPDWEAYKAELLKGLNINDVEKEIIAAVDLFGWEGVIRSFASDEDLVFHETTKFKEI